MTKKVLLVATVQSHIGQFHKPLAAVLHEAGYEVHVAARNNLAEKNGLKLDFVDKVYDLPFARSPKSPNNLKAYKQLKKILDEAYYDVVHCNTPMGGIVARLAARGTRKKGTKVFYTAHGFHFYEGAPKKNWLVFYPIEKFFSRLTDKLITITHEDYRLASSKFHCEVGHMHGVGVNDERYYPINNEERKHRRSAENLSDGDYVILCVGELNKNKDQKTLISAAGKLKNEIPNLKILLAGNGPLQHELEAQIEQEGVEDIVRMLGYRTDLENITPAVDLIVSCSHREGMPLNIIEAMLCKKPIVASINRGHKELIENGVTGYFFTPGDVDQLSALIQKIYNDTELGASMGEQGYRKAESYTFTSVLKELKDIYFGR